MPFLSPVKDVTEDAKAGHEFACCTVQRSNLEMCRPCRFSLDDQRTKSCVYVELFIIDRASNEVPWKQGVRDWKFMSKTR